MSDQQDKTEQASPFKLEEARRKGVVPRSQELLSFLMLLTFLGVFSASAWQLARVLATQLSWWLGHADELAQGWGYLRAQSGHTVSLVLYKLLPIVGALVVMAVLANLVFSGPVFSFEPLRPDFKRLNPVTGFKRMFSRKLLVELIKMLVKSALFGGALYATYRGMTGDLLATGSVSPLSLPEVSRSLMMRIGYALLAILALAAAFDMWHARKEFGRQMRMSRRELKDEHKRREGDPEIRSKRRRTQQELLKKATALSRVGEADVVVTNPTHYAVALQYRPSVMRMPVVLAMGKGPLAQRIMTIAREQRVPVMRRPPLARLLFALADIDSPIPESTHSDVARVYRWILAMPGNKVLTT